MIKVIDQMGETHEITEKMWESLKAMKNCKFRLAEIPIPKEVVEFKPTPAKQPTAVEELIEKKCCNDDCNEKVACEKTMKVQAELQQEIIEAPKNKGGRPKKK